MRATVVAGGRLELFTPGVEGVVLHAASKGVPVVCLNYTGHGTDALCEAIHNRRMGVVGQRIVTNKGQVYNLPENIPIDPFTVLNTRDDSVEKVIDKLTLVLSTVQDDEMMEVGSKSAEQGRLANAWELYHTFKYNSLRFRKYGRALQYSVSILALLTTSVALLYEGVKPDDASCKAHVGALNKSAANLICSIGFLKGLAALLPIISSFLLTVVGRFNPIAKWATLEHARQDIRAEIYQYRARVADYVPRKAQQTNILEKISDYQISALPQSSMSSVDPKAEALQVAHLQQIVRRQHGEKKRRVAPKLLRRACFATSIEDIHKAVINSELNVDSLVSPPEAWIKQQHSKLVSEATYKIDTKSLAPAAGAKRQVVREDDAELGQLLHRQEDWITDDGSSLITAEDYVRFRLQPLVATYTDELPRLGFLHRVLQTSTFFLGALTTAASLFDHQELIPLAVTLTTVLTGIAEFEQVGTRLRNMNTSLLQLKNLLTWWHSLSMVEKRLPENKEYLVIVTESTRDTEVSAWMRGKGLAKKPKGSRNKTSGEQDEDEDEDEEQSGARKDDDKES
mmetsp:Transcript_90967/g.229303  ORF Transcript_90967/g.229303 Transcript_90967/m.229303 type:complete len:568 (-) Transcript_90967:101-1804(-)